MRDIKELFLVLNDDSLRGALGDSLQRYSLILSDGKDALSAFDDSKDAPPAHSGRLSK